jgi:prevent-host-death family protein
MIVRFAMGMIGAFEAKNKLSELLDRVEHGEELTITRHGKPVAKLVPHDAGPDRGRARAAHDRMLERRRQMTLGSDITIRELIDEGRK